MWMKKTSSSRFSDFEKGNITAFKNPEASRQKFANVPNYKVNGRGTFDVAHFDKFLSKYD